MNLKQVVFMTKQPHLNSSGGGFDAHVSYFGSHNHFRPLSHFILSGNFVWSVVASAL